MARPLRIQFKNGWYHVTARGNNRRRIYFDQPDRLHFLELLGEMAERHATEVHAYALMDNHYHLLVRTPQANLSAAIQWLNVAYSIWWNPCVPFDARHALRPRQAFHDLAGIGRVSFGFG